MTTAKFTLSRSKHWHRNTFFSLLIYLIATTSSAFRPSDNLIPSVSVGRVRKSDSIESFTAEVVGSNGRFGTFWLNQHFPPASDSSDSDEDDSTRNQILQNNRARINAVACPRGAAPGGRTLVGNPIYVATPSDVYRDIYDATLPHRKSDLVFVGNAGMLDDERFQDCTILVPHYAVLYKDQWKEKDNDDGCDRVYGIRSGDAKSIQLNTDPVLSPPTYVYGKHASTVQRVLEANGIRTIRVNSFLEIKAYSARKLIWASCLWLLCHYDSVPSSKSHASSPLTVGQVHEFRQTEMDRLVDELVPSLREKLFENENEEVGADGKNNGYRTKILNEIVDPMEVRRYVRAYSMSIANAIPSLPLSKKEYPDRNEIWLRGNGENSCKEKQPFHVELLKRQGIFVDTSS